MKKLLILVFALLVCLPVMAGQLTKTILSATSIDDSPTLATSDVLRIFNHETTAFYITYAERAANTSGVSATVKVEGAYLDTLADGNWQTIPFFDTAGGVTPQTSEVITNDGIYYLWLSPDMLVPYVRVTATGTDVNSTNTIDVTVRAVGTN